MKKLLLLFFFLADMTGIFPLLAQNYVTINGVEWATRNVNAPGTFAASPESAGKLYQWNRKKSWAATGPVSSIGWNFDAPGDEWERAKDPSPVGYRLPTEEEISTLLDSTKVSAIWTIQKGVPGEKFTDIATGNSIFLPAVGARNKDNGKLINVGVLGWYWSSTENLLGGSGDALVDVIVGSAFALFLRDDSHGLTGDTNHRYGLSVRSVHKGLKKKLS